MENEIFRMFSFVYILFAGLFVANIFLTILVLRVLFLLNTLKCDFAIFKKDEEDRRKLGCCPVCNEPLRMAPGIGPICSNDDCPVIDDANLWTPEAIKHWRATGERPPTFRFEGDE